MIDNIYLDLETTGLDPQVNEIAQIGACTDSGEEFEVCVQFDSIRAHSQALALGWYDPLRWQREAVPARQALSQFSTWLESLGVKRPRVCAHNGAEFDKQFLIAAYKRQSMPYPVDYRMRDTLQLALWLMPGMKVYRLPVLLKVLCGEEIDKTTGALGDARATRAVVVAIRERFKAGLDGCRAKADEVSVA